MDCERKKVMINPKVKQVMAIKGIVYSDFQG
jgi:hypothetical protein